MSLSLPAVPDFDSRAAEAAQARLDTLTKPKGSLGRLEDLAVRLAGIQGTALPALDRKTVVVVAADHGVAARGVSAYPPEVTTQMVRNFLAGGAAICVLARAAGASLLVVDAGIREALSDPRLVDCRVGPGTADFSREPAMSRHDAEVALSQGIALSETLDADVVACGEMGIGNSSAAAAVIAALLGLPAAKVAGPGTGLDAAGVARKAVVIDEALALHRPDARDPVDLLAKVGGFEIGVLAGLMLGTAAHRRAVVIDGLISASAAMLAVRLDARVLAFMFAGHLSPEPGHALALGDLGLEPLLDLRMRLGEGTGACLALPLMDAACRLLSEMATFAQAGVSSNHTAASVLP